MLEFNSDKLSNMAWTLNPIPNKEEQEEKAYVTHYLHPTKGWKKGHGINLLMGGKQAALGFKYSDGRVEMMPKKIRKSMVKAFNEKQRQLAKEKL